MKKDHTLQRRLPCRHHTLCGALGSTSAPLPPCRSVAPAFSFSATALPPREGLGAPKCYTGQRVHSSRSGLHNPRLDVERIAVIPDCCCEDLHSPRLDVECIPVIPYCCCEGFYCCCADLPRPNAFLLFGNGNWRPLFTDAKPVKTPNLQWKTSCTHGWPA